MAESLATRVALVGAGPIGLEVACELARRRIDYLHFEKEGIGAAIARYPTGMVFLNGPKRLAIAKLPVATANPDECTKEEYLAYLARVVELRGLAVRTGEEVVDLARDEVDGFRLRVCGPRGDSEVHAERVVMAVGYATRPHRLGIPGEDLSHVSHTFAGPGDLAGRRVLVVGGSYSAFEAVLRGVEAGADVVQSYRSLEFIRRGPKGSQRAKQIRALAAAGRIELLAPTTPVSIEEGRVWLRDSHGHVRAVAADRVLLLTGYETDLSLVSRVGGMAPRPIRSWKTLETHVPGLYVAGSATTAGGPWPGFISTSHGHAACIGAHIAGEPPPLRAHRRRPRRRYEPDSRGVDVRRLSRPARRLAKRARRLAKRSRRLVRSALRRARTSLRR